MIPFFVVDRPVSLEILKGIFFEFPNLKFGLMTHANVSPRFVEAFREFPYNTPLKYFNKDKIDEEHLNNVIRRNTVRISDSGVFQKNGSNMSYEQLFTKYLSLGVQFGIIKDVLHKMNETLESAREAIKVYHKMGLEDNFQLIGVAQGKSVDEYVKCYEQLLKLGYKYIAIGGLLKRNGSSNYVRVKSENFLKNVVRAIQNEFSPDWVFVLGVYHPKRHKLLENLGVWGADYKGWLFHYDEYYSTSIKGFLIYPDVQEAYKEFLQYKKEHRKIRTNESRLKFLMARKKLDEVLRRYGTSLQELRFNEVRNFIKNNIIPQMSERGNIGLIY